MQNWDSILCNSLPVTTLQLTRGRRLQQEQRSSWLLLPSLTGLC